jgi:hypothetical protein
MAAAATLVASALAMIVIELWVRWQWDETKGRPGFFLTDATRGQRLAANYDGWFAGVPVRTNSLGFRDRRDYSLDKPPGVFRILVLGDSVTFGHGTLDDTTYPYLLEQELRRWRPDVKWEVWNLGVPGYNTAQELQYLYEIGPRAEPDLVIVGFYPNDFTDNVLAPPASVWRRSTASLLRVAQQHLYSFEFYKRVLLTARWRLLVSEDDRKRAEHLATEGELLRAGGPGAAAAEQQLTDPAPLDDPEAERFACDKLARPDASRNTLAGALRRRDPSLTPWFDAVRALQDLHRSGAYRIVFFVNMAPLVCAGADRFYDGGRLPDDDALLEVLGQGTPAVSSTRAFLQFRPSQMPAAGEHAIGNANLVKARALARALTGDILPPLLDASR